jgi:beta-N-acetylhexosaminidase
MTAHVIYAAIDAIAPATTSVTVVSEVIRGWLGFRGLLMSDDISMGALAGSVEQRARKAIGAGCDLVLHCNGELAEMRAVAAAVPVLEGAAAARAQAALARRTRGPERDIAALRAEWRVLMAGTDVARRVTS